MAGTKMAYLLDSYTFVGVSNIRMYKQITSYVPDPFILSLFSVFSLSFNVYVWYDYLRSIDFNIFVNNYTGSLVAFRHGRMGG